MVGLAEMGVLTILRVWARRDKMTYLKLLLRE
jgi:hypothetical protein